MKMIVGLGNPGPKYRNNRHNAGFMLVDYIRRELSGSLHYQYSKNAKADYAWVKISGEKIEFLKPNTFMNKSGASVSYAFKKHKELKLKDIYICHDDLDLPLGKFKIQAGTGPKLHNGIASVEISLGRRNFRRIRIGIDNRMNTERIAGETYTLQDFKPEERKMISELFPAILDRLKAEFFAKII